MSPNKDETAVHCCSSYLYCSYSGKAGCAHACWFWPNRGVKSSVGGFCFLLFYFRNRILKQISEKPRRSRGFPSPRDIQSGPKYKAKTNISGVRPDD